MDKIKVCLCDDHPIVRDGLALMLAADPGFCVVGCAENSLGLLALCRDAQPDVVVLDLSLAGESGMSLIKKLRHAFGHIGILVISMHDERMYASSAIAAGARGYLMKTEVSRNIPHAIRRVHQGQLYLSDAMKDTLIHASLAGSGPRTDPFSAMTSREREVFELIGQGMKKAQIAQALSLSPNTVETYRSKLKERFGVGNSAELARIAHLHQFGFSAT